MLQLYTDGYLARKSRLRFMTLSAENIRLGLSPFVCVMLYKRCRSAVNGLVSGTPS